MNELDLFAAAIAIPDAAQREALLDRECTGNSQQRERLRQLLDAHFRSQSPLDLPTGNRTASFKGEPATQDFVTPAGTPGTIIAGRYKLLQQIGEGGMGSVWMADQTEPVTRRVAVKLIRVERGQSKTLLSRFEAERQAIALMDHPHIARLLDAGTTEAGAPYFVMELVKGVPLNDYCDTHRLSIPDRLQLFMQICSAVQHAHQKGIIHRDLKPSNILVESHDGKPVPKVIDFGLAKATTGLKLTEHTLFTGFGSVLGTPLYMAPEQASFNAVDVDTRADIYALGVILYELLTGTTPLTREAIKQAQLDEMLRLIREQEAPTPSSRLSSSDSKPSVAANRQTEPQKLGRFVKGELDWIVLKALAKERDRRYETASGFAKDIERFLNHEPVTAGPPTAAYRFKKFVQRHRVSVIFGSVLALMVLAATCVSIALTSWALQERATAVAAQQDALAKEGIAHRETEIGRQALAEARQAEREARAVTEFLVNGFLAACRPAGEGNGLGANATIRDALAAIHSPSLSRHFQGMPRAEAATRHALGETYRDLGNLPAAATELQRALELRRQFARTEREVLLTQNIYALVLLDLGRLREAEALFQETLAGNRRHLGPAHRDTFICLNNLALVLNSTGRTQEAERHLRDGIRDAEAAYGPNDWDVLIFKSNLGAILANSGKLEEADTLLHECLAGFQRQGLRGNSRVLHCLQFLAAVQSKRRNYAEANRLLQELLAGQRRTLAAEHPDLAATLRDLADNELQLHNFAAAERYARQALAFKPGLGLREWEHAYTAGILGATLSRQQKFEEGERWLLQSYRDLKRQEAQLPWPDPLVNTLERLVRLYDAWGKKEEAAKWRQALEATKAAHGKREAKP